MAILEHLSELWWEKLDSGQIQSRIGSPAVGMMCPQQQHMSGDQGGLYGVACIQIVAAGHVGTVLFHYRCVMFLFSWLLDV